MEDLWPKDIMNGVTKIKAPVAILKEQGSLLGEKTDNIIIGEVRTVKTIAIGREYESGSFSYRFLIVSPILGYSYSLFIITHKIDLYPVEVLNLDEEICRELGFEFDKRKNPLVIAKGESEFKDLLRIIFNSTKVKGMIAAILAQAQHA